MTIDQIRTALADRNLAVIAGKTGIAYQTIARIRRDGNYMPRHDVVVKLGEYLGGRK